MTDLRSRRTAVIFLLILTALVLLRAASAARGATLDAGPSGDRTGRPRTGSGAPFDPARPSLSMRLEEPGDILAGGGTAHRTLVLSGPRAWSGTLQIDWEARVSGDLAGAGRDAVSTRSGGPARLVLSLSLPEVPGPAGMELRVRATDAGRLAAEATFPFTLYPAGAGRALADLLSRSRVGLYDPRGQAAPALAALGLRVDAFASLEGLALYQGDLIVVGPGGFARGQEALGPVLAARAGSGTPILILDQPTLPGTLSEDLRLWPAFTGTSQAEALLAPQHPVLRGLSGDGGTAYLASAPARVRPLLPPTRGNFRILAEVRVRSGPSWQEGVSLLELPIGSGTVLVAQASLCDDYGHDPRARALLANAIRYLLAERQGMRKTFTYGKAPEDLPGCLARLAPRAPTVPDDFEGVEVLVVPGDWQAPRLKASRGLPAVSQVARYLKEGGTVVLLDPQSLVLDYLRGLTGAAVRFEPAGGGPAGPGPGPQPMLQGIAPADLALLERPDRSEFRLRPAPGPDGIEALLIVPGLARYRVGRGALVAISLPDTQDCALPRTSSLLARLFTNLGVPLDPGPGLDPEAITLLSE